jgi:hypothetical protein
MRDDNAYATKERAICEREKAQAAGIRVGRVRRKCERGATIGWDFLIFSELTAGPWDRRWASDALDRELASVAQRALRNESLTKLFECLVGRHE